MALEPGIPPQMHRPEPLTAKIRVVPTGDPYLPMDQRFTAFCRVAGRTIQAYGSTPDDARAALRDALKRVDGLGGPGETID